MNLRTEVVMELQAADKFFRAHLPAGSSYQECYDALTAFAKKLIELSQEDEQRRAASQQESAPSTEISSSEVSS